MERHCGVGFELVQALDVPVLQMVEQPEEVDSFFRNFVPAVAEQVIEVPKLALPGCAVHRAALSEPQTTEQLVEVPTVLYYSLLQQRTAEHFIGIAVPRRGGGACGGLQGFSQGQDSTLVCGVDYVDNPAPHGRGGGARGGLQGLSQGQGSSVGCVADFVFSPSPHVRGGGARGGLQGLSQGQGSTADCGADFVVSPASHGRGGGARGGLHGVSQGQGSTAFCEAEHVDISVPHGCGKLGDGVFSSSSAGAADEGPAVRGSGMGKAGSTGHDASRGSSSRGKAGSTSDDALRVLAARGKPVFFEFTPVEEDEDDDYELLEYFCVSCEFLELQADVWQSLGHGDAGCCGTPMELLSSSSGLVSSSSLTTSSRRLVVLVSSFDLVEAGVLGCGQTPSTLVDLPNTVMRCALRRRSCIAGSMMRGRPRGEGLGIPSPHLGCHLRTLRSCSSSTSSSTSLSCRKRRSSWSRLFSRLQSFHSCSTFQVLDVPVVLVVLCSSWLLQAKIFDMLAGMDQKDSYGGMYNTGYAGCDTPRAVFRPGLQAHAARHHGLWIK